MECTTEWIVDRARKFIERKEGHVSAKLASTQPFPIAL